MSGPKAEVSAAVRLATPRAWARRVAGLLAIGLVAIACGTSSGSATGLPTSLLLHPTDDATVRPGSQAATNYGLAPDLLVDTRSEKDFLLRFDVAGIGTADVTRATLRLRALDGSDTGGTFTAVTDTSWDESTLTWDNAPTADGIPLGSLGPVTAGTWYELDITPLVTGDGPIAIRASSTSTNGADYASKDHPANLAPELVIDLGEPPAPPQPSAPPPEAATASVRLTAAGDHGARNSAGGQTLNLIASLDPTAHLALGDLSYSQLTPEAAWCDWVKNGDPAAGVSGVGSIPFELVAGNHEDDHGGDGFIRNFTDCLPDALGAVGDYGVEYYLDLGGLVRVIMISAGLTIDGEHYDYDAGPHREWLEESVDEARALGYPWVVVGMHKLCVSGSTKSCEIGDSVMDWLLAPGRADVVMHGHSHSVQRSHQLACVDANTTTPSCIVDTDGRHVQGEGGLILVGGTFGRSPDAVRTADREIGYFASWLAPDSTEGSGHGVWVLDLTASSLSGQWTASTGSYADAFTISADLAQD